MQAPCILHGVFVFVSHEHRLPMVVAFFFAKEKYEKEVGCACRPLLFVKTKSIRTNRADAFHFIFPYM